MASRGTSGPAGKGSSRPGARSTSARRTSARSTSPASRPPSGGSRTRTPRGLKQQAEREQGSGLWRWGVIALVTLVLLVLLAPTMRSYFTQRSDIAALERQVAASEQRVAELEEERERWNEPAYVEQKAREQLKFVRPGEVSYTVLGADEIEALEVASGQVSELRPWYDRVWASIGQADRTETDLTP